MKGPFRWLTILAVCLLPSFASAQTTTLTALWNPNPEADIAGYVLNVGNVSGAYPTAVDVGNVTQFSFAIDPTKPYYATVLAYNAAGARSGLSSEATWTPPSVPAPCTYGLTGPTTTLSSGVNTGPLTLIASTTCAPWTATSSQPWLTVLPTAGTGSTTLAFTTQANPVEVERVATVTAGTASLAMRQAAAPPPPPPPPQPADPCAVGVPQVSVPGNQYTNHFKLGGVGRIYVDLDWTAEIGDRQIVWVETQLGTQPSVRVTSPDVLATLTSLTYRSTTKGTFNLVVRAGDSAGCSGATGAVRQVRVN